MFIPILAKFPVQKPTQGRVKFKLTKTHQLHFNKMQVEMAIFTKNAHYDPDLNARAR